MIHKLTNNIYYRHAPYCLGVLEECEQYKCHRPIERCLRCRTYRRKLKRHAKKNIIIAENHKSKSRW